MKKFLCIYHGNCADGFGAAWAVRHALGEANVEFFAAVHQNAPPPVMDRHVLFVDFCYKRTVMEEIAAVAKSIVVLDHHKTAAEEMEGLGTSLAGDSRNHEFVRAMGDGVYDNVDHPKIFKLFDMNRSGAGIAWDFFHPKEPRPKLIDHIEDRDLWRFKLLHTREIQACLFSHKYDFEEWTNLIDEFEVLPQHLVQDGAAIERKHHKDIGELVAVVTRPMKFQVPYDGPDPRGVSFIVAPAANLPYTMTSDAGHLLCADHGLTGRLHEFHSFPFAACYWITPEGVVFSLRSRDDGVDVGAIAKLYGGGGHAHAAGFRVPLSRLSEFIVEGDSHG